MAPPSERPDALTLDEKWDRTIDLLLRRSVYGGLAGATAALLLFRKATSRAAVAAFGMGTGFGSAYTDASRQFSGTVPELPSAMDPSR
mmetsp:Transcript_9993/g.35502  ORF Transcript_9993/g.35502 Transcript_9993/m.35502 type:complete len:88 (+) Transcript_9993:53-316(+)